MLKSVAALLTLLAMADGSSALSQPGNLVILHGQCGRESHIAEGALGDDLRKRQRQFFCDTAIISVDNRSGDVLVQFADKKSDHQNVLGFAGSFGKDQVIDIHRAYFEIGPATQVDAGICRTFYKPHDRKKNLDSATALFCFAKVDQGGRRSVAAITFKIDQTK